MYSFYFAREILIYSSISIVFFLFIGFYWLALIVLLGVLTFGFLFRKLKIISDDGNLKTHGILRAPCNGRIQSIREGVNHKIFGENLIEIAIKISHFREYGLYLPCACEFDMLQKEKGKDFFRYFRSYDHNQSGDLLAGKCVSLRTISSREIGIQTLKCHMGFPARIWTLPGDRGASGARFGFIPLGGTVLLYLSSDFLIVSKQGDKLIGGETLIAKENLDERK